MATETEVGALLHQRGWRTAFTVAEAVNTWAALVHVIERGYTDEIHEYTNDLYCRNWLHEAWLLLDEHIVQLWTQQIEALDDRYRAATSMTTAMRSGSSTNFLVPTCGGGDDVPASSPENLSAHFVLCSKRSGPPRGAAGRDGRAQAALLPGRKGVVGRVGGLPRAFATLAGKRPVDECSQLAAA